MIITLAMALLTSTIPAPSISNQYDFLVGFNILSSVFLITGVLVYISDNFFNDIEFRIRSVTLMAIGVAIEIFTLLMFNERNLYIALNAFLATGIVLSVAWIEWDDFHKNRTRRIN
jgi:O-antigen/teichoic acid export membrane protein